MKSVQIPASAAPTTLRITRSELYVPLHGKVGDRCPYCDAALEMQL